MNNEPFIVASRGRNPENPSDRTVGAPTEQRLEPNSQGICNTLTTVQKDNYVVEPVTKVICETRYDEGIRFFENDICGSLRTIDACGNKAVIEADLIGNIGGRKREIHGNLRIRKLTPKECYRLMGFDDESFHKAEATCSNTQLYKQAGNSIVVDVLEHLFMNLKPYLYTGV